jgi:hypothetical protein
METTQTVRHPQDAAPPSFETVWAILQEVGKKQEELAESQKETDRQMKENAARLDKQLGKLGNRMGEMIEYMVAPNLREKFRDLGLNFPQVNQNSDVADYDNKIFLEIDVKLENDDKVMLVEVKTNLTTRDVQDHIKRLKKMRVYADLHGDRRTFLGSVAGAVVKANVKEYALGNGLYVIEPSRGEPSPLCGSVEYTGETFNITPPNGQPKEW